MSRVIACGICRLRVEEQPAGRDRARRQPAGPARRHCKQKRAGALVNTSPDPVGRTIKRSVSVEAFCFCALEGTADFFFCLFSAHPVRAFDALAGLEVLVDLEEVLDFQAVEL